MNPRTITLIAAAILLPGAAARAQTGGLFDLSWNTFDGGGLNSISGASLTLGGTLGQADASSPLSGGNFSLTGGLWPGMSEDATGMVAIASANPPTDNLFVAGQQPFRDVLQTGATAVLTQGIGSTTTPIEDTVTYATISVTFNAAPTPVPTPANVNMSCVGAVAFACPNVTGVLAPPPDQPGPFQLSLNGPMPPGACMTLTFAGTVAGQKLQYQYLPGDMNFSGLVSASDVIVLVNALGNGQAALPANLPRYDVNRNGAAANSDLLRLIGLLNGLNTAHSWSGATVAACP